MELFALLMSLLAYLPFLTIALIAQWGDRHRVARSVTYGLILWALGAEELQAVTNRLRGRRLTSPDGPPPPP